MTSSEAARDIPFLRALPAPLRTHLLKSARVQVLERGEIIWNEGEATKDFHFAVRGRVRLIKRGECGRETIVELSGPGDMLCGNAVFCQVAYCCAGRAVERATAVLALPQAEVLRAVEASPKAALAFVHEITARGMRLCGRIEVLGAGRVERRIALLFVTLADKVGQPGPDGSLRVPIKLSRQEIADLVSTTLESAIRAMSRLRRERIMRSVPSGFQIDDRTTLLELAGLTPPPNTASK